MIKKWIKPVLFIPFQLKIFFPKDFKLFHVILSCEKFQSLNGEYKNWFNFGLETIILNLHSLFFSICSWRGDSSTITFDPDFLSVWEFCTMSTATVSACPRSEPIFPSRDMLLLKKFNVSRWGSYTQLLQIMFNQFSRYLLCMLMAQQ